MADSIRVLHVDDEPDFLEVATTFLERIEERLKLATADSASEALDRLAEGEIDCVISDFDMPGMDGIEFLEAVRDDYPDLPFILYTGKGSEEIASEAISAGVNDYLQKGTGTDQYTLLANRVVNAVEKHAAEREVETTKHRFETLLQHSADFIHVLDEDGVATYHSPSVERVLGYEPDELEGINPFEGLHPEDRETVLEKFDYCIEEPGREVTVETRVRHKDGTWRWLEVKSRNLLEDPMIGGVVGNVRDITERKETEAAVDWHKAIIRNMREGVYVMNDEYEFQFVNYRAQDLEDISEEDWTGRSLSYLADIDMLSESELEEVRTGVDRILADEVAHVSLEIEPALPESTEVIELRLIELEVATGEDLVLGTTRDITDRKRRERKLEEEKAFNEAALESIVDFYWTIDLDGTVTRWSDADGEVTGYTPEEAVGMQSSTFHPEGHVPLIQAAIDEIIAEGSATVEADLLTKEGERVPYRFTGVALTDDSGVIRSLCGLGQDITERAEHERQLKRQNERLDQFARMLSEGLEEPLRVAAEKLELAGEDPDSENFRDAQDAIEQCQTRIEGLLALAREGSASKDVEATLTE